MRLLRPERISEAYGSETSRVSAMVEIVTISQPGMNYPSVCAAQASPADLLDSSFVVRFGDSSVFSARRAKTLGVGQRSALTGCLNKCFFELVGRIRTNFWRPIIGDAHSLHSLGDCSRFHLSGNAVVQWVDATLSSKPTSSDNKS